MEVTEEEIKEYPWLNPRPGWYGPEEIPTEWKPMIMEMCAEIKIWLKEHNVPETNYFLDQGKEKWGDLCWYDEIEINGEVTEEAWDLNQKLQNDIVDKYVKRAAHICLICGKEFEEVLPYKGPGWVHRECPECTSKRTKK